MHVLLIAINGDDNEAQLLGIQTMRQRTGRQSCARARRMSCLHRKKTRRYTWGQECGQVMLGSWKHALQREDTGIIRKKIRSLHGVRLLQEGEGRGTVGLPAVGKPLYDGLFHREEWERVIEIPHLFSSIFSSRSIDGIIRPPSSSFTEL